MSLLAMILAGGEGTRMKSALPKTLHKACGKPMLDRVLSAAKEAGADKICVIVGSGADSVREHLADEPDVSFALQEPRLGTGHAVICAKDALSGRTGEALVLYGDTPLLTGKTLKELVAFHRAAKNGVSFVSVLLDDPTGYGRVLRDENGAFLRNVEHKDATPAERMTKEVNAGAYCFDIEALSDALGKLKNDNAAGEYYLPDTLELIKAAGRPANAMLAPDAKEFSGVNSKTELARATAVLRERINFGHIENGVEITDPANTYIDESVIIAPGAVILPGTTLEGETEIGAGSVIGPNSRLTDTKIGERTTVEQSVLREALVGNGVNIGPFAFIRPDSVIGDEVKIGDFVEVKNSKIGAGTKVAHLTYIGDADVGSGINFGCGTVIVNYNGKKKYRTVIGDGAFIGCNANLISPVTIGEGAYIAAGSTINKDVPPDSLAVARAKQTNIEDGRKKLGL